MKNHNKMKPPVTINKKQYSANSAVVKRHAAKKREKILWTGDMGPRVGSFKKN